jgi:hypothetical protein
LLVHAATSISVKNDALLFQEKYMVVPLLAATCILYVVADVVAGESKYVTDGCTMLSIEATEAAVINKELLVCVIKLVAPLTNCNFPPPLADPAEK